jgi:hypothetical protein
MRFVLHSNFIETVKEGLQIQEFLYELFLLNPLTFETPNLTLNPILTKIKGLQLGGQTGYLFRQNLNNKIHKYAI